MNEANLIQKLLKIEALFAGAATPGERDSAELARQRILYRLRDLLPKDPPVEYKFTFGDMWSRKVFVTLLRRYNLKPYRYYRQRYTTVMVRVPKQFVDETLWPEFQKIDKELNIYLKEVTDRIVKEVLHEDSSDAEVVNEPLQLDITDLDQKNVSGQPASPIDHPKEAPDKSATGGKRAKSKQKRGRKKKGKKKKRR